MAGKFGSARHCLYGCFKHLLVYSLKPVLRAFPGQDEECLGGVACTLGAFTGQTLASTDKLLLAACSQPLQCQAVLR